MRYAFGKHVLDTERHELSERGRPIGLRPKAFRLLAQLVEERRRVLTKEELLAANWPPHVSEEVLTSCIAAVRRALDDDARRQEVIRTVHGVGYRFVAPVEDLDEGDPADAAAAEEPDSAKASPVTYVPVVSPALQPASSAPITGQSTGGTMETRTVALLSCAIGDRGEMVARLGAEEAGEMVRSFLSVAEDVVDRHGGTVSQWRGDGFLAVFGAPVAHEDDTRRAALAATELVGIPRPNEAGSGLAVCAGIHSGPAVLSIGTRGVFVARSDATDVADAVRGRAPPGTVLVSAAVHAQIAGEFETLAEATARDDWGVESSAPWEAVRGCWRLGSIVKRRAGVPRRDNVMGRFVGRGAELAVMRERWAQARAGRGQVVVVCGPAGQGKSRLLDEFLDHAENALAEPPEIASGLRGQCLPYACNTPYVPLIEIFRQAPAEDMAGFDPRDVALMRELLCGIGTAIEDDPRERRRRTFTLLRRLLDTATARRPQILAIEDVHWIDATSRDWLSALAADLQDASVLLIVTSRSPLARWLGDVPATVLSLPPLTEADSTALVRSIRPGLSGRLEEDLVAKAAGNPFFLEELVHSQTSKTAVLPDTVQAVILGRMDVLEPAQRSLLQTCAAFGQRVAVEQVALAVPLDPASLDAALSALQAGGFLRELQGAPRRSFRFKHALTQEVAYASLSQRRRVALHARIAELLITRFTHVAERHPEAVAIHLARAGQTAAAIPYWRRAARRAFERSANVEAAAYAEAGLELVLSAGGNHDAEQLALELTLAPAVVATHGYGAPEVGPIYERARALGRRLGDEGRLFRAEIGLWNYHWVRGELSTARDVAAMLLERAGRTGTPEHAMRAHAALGEIQMHLGELEGSLSHLRRAANYYRELDGPSLAARIPHVACLSFLAWAAWHRGELAEADQAAADAEAAARGLGHPLSLALCLSLRAEFHQFRLEPGACIDAATEALGLAREHGLPFWEGTALVNLGWARSVDASPGNVGAGRALIEEGIAIFEGTGARIQATAWQGMLAEALELEGRSAEAMAALDRAFEAAERTGECYYVPELYRLKGRLLMCGGAAEAGIGALRQGVRMAAEQGARVRCLRTIRDLAPFIGVEELSGLLGPLRPWLELTDDFPDLSSAASLLRARPATRQV